MFPYREHPNWQGIWERLRKLGLEFDHDRRNGIVKTFERLYNPAPVGWRSLFERYVEGDAEVHVHIHTNVSVLPDVLDASNLCATFKWPQGVLLNDSEHKFWCGATRHDSPNVVECDEEEAKVKVAMLVDVPEFIENRKRLFGRILPTVKRLQLLDECAKVWPDSPEDTRFLVRPSAGRPISPGADGDPGTRDGRYDIMLDWIKNYGVLGLLPAGNFGPNLRSEREEHLFLFWHEVGRAARCMALFKAATGPAGLLKRSGVPGKTLAEKRKWAETTLFDEVRSTLRRECFPKLFDLYYHVREDSGEMTDVGLGLDFRSLLGAMYLQMAWRITSRRCDAPGCNNIIGLDKRSDAKTCDKNCKEKRRYHRNKEAAKLCATSREATAPPN